MQPGAGSSSSLGTDSVKVDDDALVFVADQDSLTEVLRQRFDRLPALRVGADRKGRVVYTSPSFERLIEYKRDERIGSAMRLVEQTFRSACGKTLKLWSHLQARVNPERE